MGRTLGKEAQEIDVNGWMSRTTLEMLGQAGLGYSFDDFTGESSNSYGESLKLFLYAHSLFPPGATLTVYLYGFMG